MTVAHWGRQRHTGRPLTSFLTEHEACRAEFDVRREAGLGALQVICEGCGARIEYPAESGVGLSAGQVHSALAASARQAPSAPAPPSPSPVPGLLAIVGTGAALVAAVILLSSGLGGSDDGSGRASSAGVRGTPTSSPTSASPRRQPARSGDRPRMDRHQVADRFSIALPSAWHPDVDDGALAATSRRGDAEVECYFEDGVRPRRELVRRTSAFLHQRHPDARISKARSERLGARPAERIVASYPRGSEAATVFVASGYTYLVLERIDRGATAGTRRAADAIVASVRPI